MNKKVRGSQTALPLFNIYYSNVVVNKFVLHLKDPWFDSGRRHKLDLKGLQACVLLMFVPSRGK